VAGSRLEIRVSECLSALEGVTCGRMCGIRISVAQLLLGDSDGKVALLDAVALFDEPLTSCRPGIRPAAFSA
jgi:hypothetical protein